MDPKSYLVTMSNKVEGFKYMEDLYLEDEDFEEDYTKCELY